MYTSPDHRKPIQKNQAKDVSEELPSVELE